MNLTREQILNEPAGDQMNEWIAVYVMVWHEVRTRVKGTVRWENANNEFEGLKSVAWGDYTYEEYGEIFMPSTHITDAWEVVERMEELGYWYSSENTIPNSDPIGYHFGFHGRGQIFREFEFTLPLAICRTALLAKLEEQP